MTTANKTKVQPVEATGDRVWSKREILTMVERLSSMVAIASSATHDDGVDLHSLQEILIGVGADLEQVNAQLKQVFAKDRGYIPNLVETIAGGRVGDKLIVK